MAVAVANDREAEALIHGLRLRGYEMFAQVEQETKGRLATMRLRNEVPLEQRASAAGPH